MGPSPWGRAAAAFVLVVGSVLAVATVTIPAWRDRLADATITPLPGFVPGAVDALVAVTNGVRAVAPLITVGAVVAMVAVVIAGWGSERQAAINRLSTMDYTGIDHLDRAPRGGLLATIRGWLTGTALATLAIVLVGATSGIEDEVTNGPLRPVDALIAQVSGGPVSFVYQGPHITFMDDSTVSPDDIDQLAAASDAPVVPFGKHLFNLNGTSAIQLSVPDDVFAGLAGRPEPAGCDGRGIVVDDTVGAAVGETVTVNGIPFTVRGVADGIAQMNRSVAIVAESAVRRCVLGGTATGYFGALVATGDTEVVAADLGQAGLAELAAVSEADFKEENRDFWRANATPLLLQLILYLALFSGFAAAGERQSALQRTSREIGMLHAAGVDFAVLRAVEVRRALRTTLIATVLAAPLMVPVAAAFNASELGVQIGVGPIELAVGVSLTGTAMVLASLRSMRQFRRSLDLPLAVKG